MKGADDYCRVFEKTQQIGNLYFLCGSHARGKTFKIFILPDIDGRPGKAITNGPSNPPVNRDTVEVYGITSGQPGWTESYGWLHKGKWEQDVEEIYTRLKTAQEGKCQQKRDQAATYSTREELRVRKLLDAYK
jgi:hypothetical protein